MIINTFQVYVEFYEHPDQSLTIHTDADLQNCCRDQLMSELDRCIAQQLGEDLADDIASVDYGIEEAAE
jgi:hypothetical protein